MKKKREEILKTIFRLFLTNHYENVSYDDMIKATNISKGGLYHYAPNKNELFRLVIDEFFYKLICVDVDMLTLPLGDSKSVFYDFLLRYAKFLHMRFSRIQDFLQLSANETARSFTYFVLNSQRYYPSLSDIVLSVADKEKELLKSFLLVAEKNGEIKPDMNLSLVSDMFYKIYSGLLLYSSFSDSYSLEHELLLLYKNIYSLIKADT